MNSETLSQKANKELRNYIEANVFPCYQGVDPAHGEEHVRTVINNALELASGYDVDLNMVYAIACYHDIGIRYGRDDHEMTSARWLLSDAGLDSFFSKEQKAIMAEAIEDHRASSKREPRSIYGRIIAEADRDIEPMRILRRSLQFARARNPQSSDEEVVQISYAHIQEKYGVGGYLKLYLPESRNQAGLDTLRGWIASGEMLQLLREQIKNLS